MRFSFSSRAVSIRIGTVERGADGAREIEPALARHHDVENEQIEFQAGELGPRVGRGLRGRNAIAFAEQEARQQRTDAPVVVDDKKMRRVISRICAGASRFSHPCRS